MKRGVRGKRQEDLLAAFAVEIGQRARMLRLAANVSQNVAASRAGISATALRDFERGKVDLRAKTLRRIAHALGIELIDLINIGNDRRAAVVQLTRSMSEEELAELHKHITSRLIAR